MIGQMTFSEYQWTIQTLVACHLVGLSTSIKNVANSHKQQLERGRGTAHKAMPSVVGIYNTPRKQSESSTCHNFYTISELQSSVPWPKQ